MKIEHTFTVPAPVDTVWRALLDPERVALCFPGATVTSVDGAEFAGTVKVRLGPISLLYKGSGRFIETDEVAHRAVIEASASASGGQGTASATVSASLIENGEATTVTVKTQLSIMGKPAQFGRGLIEDVGKKIISQFADCLASNLGSPKQAALPSPDRPDSPAGLAESAASAPSAPQAPSTGQVPPVPARLVPQQADEEIDLLAVSGGAVAKRVAPVIGGLVLLLVILRWLRNR
ncbi:MAG: SRPBCC family protein [Pseudonocardiales bacterium]